MANFLAHAIFETELTIKKNAQMVWSSAFPLLTSIHSSEANFNPGFEVSPSDGNVLVPLNYSDDNAPADGRAVADMFTPNTIGVTTGFDHAKYPMSRYEKRLGVRADERRFIESGQRMSFLPNRGKQTVESFKVAVSGVMAGAANATIENVLGLRYGLSTANSPGGIDQGANTWWRARVVSNIGGFSTTPFQDQWDLIGTRGQGAPDLLGLSIVSGNNVFGRFRDAAPTQLVTSPTDKVRFGYPGGFTWNNCYCIADNWLGAAASGTGYLLSTAHFYAGGDDGPRNVDGESAMDRIPGTGSFEMFYDGTCGWPATTGTCALTSRGSSHRSFSGDLGFWPGSPGFGFGEPEI